MTAPTQTTDHIEDRRTVPFYMTENVVVDHYLARIGSHAHAIYTVLTRFAGQQGSAFPGVSKIVELTGQSRSGVHNGLRRLEDTGMIRIEHRLRKDGGNTSNLYILLPLCPHDVQGGVHVMDGGCPPDAQGVSTPCTPPCPPDVWGPVHMVDTNIKTQSYKDSFCKDTNKKTQQQTPAPPQTRAKPEASVVVSIAHEQNARIADMPASAITIGSTARALDTSPPVPASPPLRLSEPLEAPPVPSRATGERSEPLAEPLEERDVPVPPPQEIIAAAAALGVRIGGKQESVAVTALLEMGVKPTDVARRIADKRSERLILDWCAAIRGGHVDTSKRGAAAVLVSALAGDDVWDLPQAYLAAQRDARNRAAQKAEDARRAQMRTQAAQQARDARQALEERWETMAAPERAAVEGQARREINGRPMGERLLAGAGGAVMVRERCLELVRNVKTLDIAHHFLVDDVCDLPQVRR